MSDFDRGLDDSSEISRISRFDETQVPDLSSTTLPADEQAQAPRPERSSFFRSRRPRESLGIDPEASQAVAELDRALNALDRAGKALFGANHSWDWPGYSRSMETDNNRFQRLLDEKGVVPKEVMLRFKNANPGVSVPDTIKRLAAYGELKLFYNQTAAAIRAAYDPRLDKVQRNEVLNELYHQSKTITPQILLNQFRRDVAPHFSVN